MEKKQKNLKEKIITFCKQETVFAAAIAAAVISAFFVPPSAEYLKYPDYRVLALLFCLMILVAGLKELRLFAWLGEKLTLRAKNSRQLILLLVGLCFFTSMLITNDVALITFVPFAILLLQFSGLEEKIIKTVVLQTIAANLGSMMTPVGNPQNLYLYTMTGMSIGRFLLLMLPLTLLSLFLLTAVVLLDKPCEIKKQFSEGEKVKNKRRVGILISLFGICLLTVVRILPFQYSLLIVAAAILIMDKSLYRKVDYCLLGTFLGFFIFVGNMQRIPYVKEYLEQLLNGRELYLSVLASQIISNMPAAMLLSGFTKEYEVLLYGVNIGGMGTLVASLASVISYKSYSAYEGAKKGKYIAVFTFWSVIFLAVLLLAANLLLKAAPTF